MKQGLVIFFIIFFSAIFQLAFFFDSFSSGLGPDIALLMVIFWTASEGFDKALGRNILAGLILDLAMFSIIGTHIASFVLVAFFVSFISKRFLVVTPGWRIFILAMTIVFGTLANNLFLNGLFFLANYFGRIGVGSVPIDFFSLIMLKAIFLNLLFSWPVYFILKKIKESNLLKRRINIA